jgi:hypothetical protein
MTWMQTFSGKAYIIAEPTPDQICLEDIARALSQQCRFAGHSSVFYSVAEHSIHVCNRVKEILEVGEAILPTPPGLGVVEEHHKLLASALLHDASEAYLLDIPRPLKIHPEMEFYREQHAKTMKAILEKFGIQEGKPDIVTRADNEMLATEKEQVMAPPPKSWGPMLDPIPITLSCWNPGRAYNIFMKQAEALGLTDGNN